MVGYASWRGRVLIWAGYWGRRLIIDPIGGVTERVAVFLRLPLSMLLIHICNSSSV